MYLQMGAKLSKVAPQVLDCTDQRDVDVVLPPDLAQDRAKVDALVQH